MPATWINYTAIRCNGRARVYDCLLKAIDRISLSLLAIIEVVCCDDAHRDSIDRTRRNAGTGFSSRTRARDQLVVREDYTAIEREIETESGEQFHS